MQTIFDVPMGTDQRQHPLGRPLTHRKAAESIHDLVADLPGVEDARSTFEPKDLLDALPLVGKPVIQIGATDDLSMLQSSMTFVPGFRLLPAPTIRAAIAETGQQYLRQESVGCPWP